MADQHDVTVLIQASAAGDPDASKLLWRRVYDELHAIARSRIGGLGPGATLDTTGLVHESFLRLAGAGLDGYANRKHFFATAAQAMRQIVIDQLRRRGAQRRLPGADVADAWAPDLPWPEQLVDAAVAFERLHKLEPRLAQVAELRIFGGLEMTEIALLMGQSERTVRRDWQKARALLAISLEAPGHGH